MLYREIAGAVAFYIYLVAITYLKAPFISEYISTFVGGVAGYWVCIIKWSIAKISNDWCGSTFSTRITITNSMRDIIAERNIYQVLLGL